MVEIGIPYGKGHIKVQIATERLQGVLESRAHQYHPEAEQVN